MLTIKQLTENVGSAKVKVRGVELTVTPLSAAKSSELLGLCPAPPRPADEADHQANTEYARLYSGWVLAVELHEFAVLVDYQLDDGAANRERSFDFSAPTDAKRRWLECARREIGGTLTRAEIQAVLRAADKAARGTEDVRGN